MKKILSLMLLMSSVLIGFAQTSFITVWDTNKLSGTYAGASSTTIKLPVDGGTYQGSWVKVGEPATTGTFTNATLTNHIITVPSAGNYEVTISNAGAGFFWQIGTTPAATDREKLMEVKQWGNLWIWGDKTHMFNGCLNLQVTATDVPELAGGLQSMFKDCTNLTGNASFNSWNVSNVNNMNGMFYGAKAFNQPLNNWNTGAVQNMGDMFRSTDLFNQPIGNWNTSNVTAMTNMFETSKAFNQPLNTWDVSNVTNLNGMFSNSVFNNASLGGWTFKSGVTMTSFLQSSNSGTGMDCINFSNTLKAWSNNSSMPNGLTVGALNRKYGDQVAYDKLTTEKNWKINNASYDAACAQILPVTFAGISANIINGDLLVQWKTASEKNNDHFLIQISKDGEKWHEVASVQTKAENGNSNEVLKYQHTIKLNSLQLAGIPLFITLLLATLLFNRKNRVFISMILLAGVFLVGCSKIDLVLEEIDNEVLYLKITQIDKDGKTSSDSEIISVKR